MSLRAKLRAGETTFGSWITLGHVAIAEIMAKAGFDWVVVDLEHSVIGVERAGDMIRVIDLCGTAPLVRLTSHDADQIKRVMDAGAHGIIVPMVKTAEEARWAVAATRYAPVGTRGAGLGRAQGYGVDFHRYSDWLTDGPVVIVQIEHVDAIDHLDDILAVPGVDGFIIGPYDLSCSLGLSGQFEAPAFVAAMTRIREAGTRRGCVAGLHIVEPDLNQLDRTLAEGYNFIAYSVDIRMLDVAVRQGLARARKTER
ncbi:MAG: 2-dehydro-3-deoxyglucarate aldolase [Gemmatimonadetes bacterium]|nr:2-dehydro-3-deoxyglucarate aldolase [Gemmatimonadota bacterium]